MPEPLLNRTLEAWPGHLGLRNLAVDETRLRKKIRKGFASAEDYDRFTRTRRAQGELRALYRARLRVELEDARTPLDVVKLQAEELAHDGHLLDCLNPDDLIELRKREPDWTPWGKT